MKLYGWHELNEASYGITVELRDWRFFKDSDFDPDTGELSQLHAEHPGGTDREEGRWFKRFSDAKRAFREEVNSQIAWRREAVRRIMKMKVKRL